jgi:2-phosphosulfolactate phosphatase
MTQNLRVYDVPTQVDPEELAGGTVVVIDVLRATTTILYALAAGAAEVIACLEIDDALKIAGRLPRSQVVLGGERGGLPIEGFDLGNSPLEYDPAAVAGKTIMLATTNGTRAMHRCRLAELVFIGAFVNAGALADRLAGLPKIAFLCAGADGDVTRDDVLFAGLMVERLQRRSAMAYRLNPQAIAAQEQWLASLPAPMTTGAERLPPPLLADQLRKGLAGQKLVAIGMEDDLYAAAQLDRFSIVPVLDPGTFRIHVPGPAC